MKNPLMNPSRINHLSAIADTPPHATSNISPQKLLEYLRESSKIFKINQSSVISLVYSTTEGNTGWTGFVFSPYGQLTFHHWDLADPCILQIDIMLNISFENIRSVFENNINQFWNPSNLEIFEFNRLDSKISISPQRKNLEKCEFKVRSGAGPNGHNHLLICAQLAPDDEAVFDSNKMRLNIFSLIDQINMVAMTNVYSMATEGKFKFVGYIVGITTSHISLRYIKTQNSRLLWLDVFSCRDIDGDRVMKWLSASLPVIKPISTVKFERYPNVNFNRATKD